MPVTPRHPTAAMKRLGWTLIETLIVVGVAVVLLAITVPVYRNAIERARDTACQAQLRGFGPAFQRFREDNRGQLPYAETNASFRLGRTRPWDQLAQYLDTPLPVYDQATDELRTGAPFVCPSDRTVAIRTGVSYWYGPWQMMGMMGQAAFTTMVERDPGPWALLHDGDEFHRATSEHRGMNQLRLDYSVGKSPPGSR